MCDVVVYTVVDHYNLFGFTLCLSNSQAKSGEWQQLSHSHEYSTRWPKLVGERVRYCECLRGRSHCTKKMVHFCRILTSSGSLRQRRDSTECLQARKGRHVQPPPRFVVEGAQRPHVVRPPSEGPVCGAGCRRLSSRYYGIPRRVWRSAGAARPPGPPRRPLGPAAMAISPPRLPPPPALPLSPWAQGPAWALRWVPASTSVPELP